MSAYSLGKACWIVRKLDGSAGRRAVFEDVVRKNPIVRFFYVLYGNSPEFLKSLLLLMYGLKSYLSVKWADGRNADIAFFASYPNEHVVLGYLRQRLGVHLRGLDDGTLSIARANCFSLQSLRDLPAFLAQLPRLYRLAGKFVRRFHFMPACRIFSTLAYYARFRRLLAGSGARAVFIANHYSPECLALAVAAHGSGRRVLFTNHANATWNTGFVPPLYCDLAAVTSQAVLDVYRAHSHKPFAAVFLPQTVPQRPMLACINRHKPITVGIFLTGLAKRDRLRALVAQLEANPQVGRILIRPHPVKAIREDLSGLCSAATRTSESGSLELSDNIARCDLAICGNSSVTVAILRGGVPVFYDAGLDAGPDDANRYVAQGLIPSMPARLDEAALRLLEDFYGAPAWLRAMHYFDAGYRQDEAVLFQRLARAVEAAVRPAPAGSSETAPGETGIALPAS